MSGYFSVEDRGTFGHWDISNGQRRLFCIRGEPGDFGIRDERKTTSALDAEMLSKLKFRTPMSALVWISDELCKDFTPLPHQPRSTEE